MARSDVNKVRRLAAVSVLFLLGVGVGFSLRLHAQPSTPPSNEEVLSDANPKVAKDISAPNLSQTNLDRAI